MFNLLTLKQHYNHLLVDVVVTVVVVVAALGVFALSLVTTEPTAV